MSTYFYNIITKCNNERYGGIAKSIGSIHGWLDFIDLELKKYTQNLNFSWFVPYQYALSSALISRGTHPNNQAIIQGIRIGCGNLMLVRNSKTEKFHKEYF